MFKDWQLAMMEDYGLMDTNTGLINRVARTLTQSPNDSIDTAEFRSACSPCGVDLDPRSLPSGIWSSCSASSTRSPDRFTATKDTKKGGASCSCFGETAPGRPWTW